MVYLSRGVQLQRRVPRHIDRRELGAIDRIDWAALPKHLGDAADHGRLGLPMLTLAADLGDIAGAWQIASVQNRDEAHECLIAQFVAEELLYSCLWRL